MFTDLCKCAGQAGETPSRLMPDALWLWEAVLCCALQDVWHAFAPHLPDASSTPLAGRTKSLKMLPKPLWTRTSG